MNAPGEPTVGDPNAHVSEFLRYYVGFANSPGYAVLINGLWGVGKTYVINRLLGQLFSDNKRYAYVSLFGLSSIGDIDRALLQARYPVLSWRSTKIAGKVAKAALSFLNADPDLKPEDLTDQPDFDLIVFDDLERVDMPINQVLGYLNGFVEQDGKKVLVLANEDEIHADGTYRKRREKLIGQTLEVAPDFTAALAHFRSTLTDAGLRDWLQEHEDDVRRISEQSALKNLRVLQQTMWDFERLYSVLTPEQRTSETGLLTLFRLFFAVSLEVRSGRVAPQDLLDRNNAYVREMMSKKSGPFVEAVNRYSDVQLTDTTLSDQTLHAVLIKGIFDADAIREDIERSRAFFADEPEPAWQTVWHVFDRSDAEFEAALSEMERAFHLREYGEAGEVLHVLAIRNWLARNGIIGVSLAQALEQGYQYIDDIYFAGRLRGRDPVPMDDLRYGSWGGLGFFDRETQEFGELYTHLRNRQDQATLDQLPAIGSELVDLLRTAPDEFVERITSEEHRLVRVPVLASVEVGKFVDAFLPLHPSKHRAVLLGLKERYTHARIVNELAKEQPWLESLRSALKSAANNLSTIGKHRLSEQVRWSLDQVLGSGEDHAQA